MIVEAFAVETQRIQRGEELKIRTYRRFFHFFSKKRSPTNNGKYLSIQSSTWSRLHQNNSFTLAIVTVLSWRPFNSPLLLVSLLFLLPYIFLSSLFINSQRKTKVVAVNRMEPQSFIQFVTINGKPNKPPRNTNEGRGRNEDPDPRIFHLRIVRRSSSSICVTF